ncbi:hypothetical protein [Niveispirillum sp.]|uniref:hypothetical protein n=1 Tax=Niveispirillum sp. TaxID=1917217 RepID=UPI001B4EB110|nr:hypothetical protein [Niveispirillum sp.]MBP7339358.1 hypothetical protein [Niveispirillum sp.]
MPELRASHKDWHRAAHADNRWAHFVNIALAAALVSRRGAAKGQYGSGVRHII